MMMNNALVFLELDFKSRTPIYFQLAEKILNDWVSKQLISGELLPSLQDLSTALDILKNTVEKAYGTLRDLGVLSLYKRKRLLYSSEKTSISLDKFKAPGN